MDVIIDNINIDWDSIEVFSIRNADREAEKKFNRKDR